MVNAIVTVQGGPVAPPTLLGCGPLRIPTGGKIRPGIMVLTRKAAEQAEAKAIYGQGLEAGHSFEQIGRALQEALPHLRSPLVPRNVPWFTVRPQDFAHPELARQILDTYGEDRGRGRHLYRFPVVFPSDQWQSVMPHELAAWSTHEKRFWSQYSPDGQIRHCMRHAPVPMEATGRRTIRVFGGRKVVPREENGGLCDPESCPEYQDRQCNLVGRFLFFIPGIRSLSALELPTTSFYAMSHAIQRFQAIAHLRGGRISGFLDRERTTFFLSKVLRDVPHLDEQGRAVRVPQWIIELEAPVDVTALLREDEDRDTAIQQGEGAARALQAAAEPQGVQVLEPDIRAMAQPIPTPRAQAAVPNAHQILARAQAAGIAVQPYQAYAEGRWGPDWEIQASSRVRAWDELERYRNDAGGYQDKIASALRSLG